METTKKMTTFLALVLIISVFAAFPVHSLNEDGMEIVLVRTGEQEILASLEKDGARILETYDTFALVELDPTSIPQLRSKGISIDSMDHRTLLYVRDETFDFTLGEPEIPSSLRLDSYEPGVEGQYIVHTLGPIAEGWVPELEDMGVDVLHYMHNFAYRVRMTPELAREVEDLYFVDWVGIYHPYYKLDPGLTSGPIEVGMLPGATQDSFYAANEIIPELTYAEFQNGATYLYTSVESKETLHELALINDVSHISRYVEPELYSEVATQIVAGGRYFFNDDGGNPYRKHGDYGAYINQIGYEGDGVLVAVADTGINDHSDYQDRLVGGYSYSGGWGDAHGHGTHCAGSVAGNTYLGTGSTSNGYYRGQGTAPEADLYSIRIFGGSGGASWIGPSDIYDILFRGAQAESEVHSNSWGASTGGSYGTRASRFDQGVKDFEIVTVVAAGNDGPSQGTIGEPAAGKNVIAVGSSTKGTTTSSPGMSSFSSRGWTQDNRIKPDVTAPGSSVISTSHSSSTGYTTMSGTSMACPAAAGAAAVTYEWYRVTQSQDPSAAMVKALLINTANQFTGNIPNRNEGWGMVDISKLERPLNDPVPFVLFDQDDTFTSSGQTTEYHITYDRTGEPLKFSLVWTDEPAPGDTGSGPSLINDLNIIVESPSGDVYRGNAFSGGWSQPNTGAMSDFDRNNDGWDDTNNVENVYIPSGSLEEGVYTVTVEANNIASGSQHYALVAYNAVEGAIGDPPEVSVTGPSGGETFNAGTQETITWTTTPGDDPVDRINLEYSVDAGSNWQTIDTNLADTGSYTWTVPNEHSSGCLVRVEAVDTGGRSGDAESAGTFTIVGTPPAPPENLAVEHTGTGVVDLFYDDVEGGDLGYTTGTSESAASEWGIREHGSTVGDNSWDFGDGQYHKVNDYGYLSWLISPEIEIPASASDVELSFDHWRSFGFVTTYLDGGNFKLSTDGVNGNFDLITPNEGYDGEINPNFGNPLGGQQGWGGTAGWETVTFDLSAYAGETIHLRWDAGIEAYDEDIEDGWRVDNIRITGEVLGIGDEHNLLTWDASPDDPDEVSAYNVYRSEEAAGTYDHIGSVSADGSALYEYIDVNKGADDGIQWWYMVRAVGTNGLEEQNENAVPEPDDLTTTEVPLTSGGAADGWNFVSFNVVPQSTSLADILEDPEHGISGQYDSVMYYDSSAGRWYSYVPDRPEHFNNLETWDHTMGVWIRATSNTVLTIAGSTPGTTSVTLQPGWNMVGLPSETTGNHGLPAEVTSVGYFDASSEYNIVYTDSVSNFQFSPGEAYWIYNDAETNVQWQVSY